MAEDIQDFDPQTEELSHLREVEERQRRLITLLERAEDLIPKS